MRILKINNADYFDYFLGKARAFKKCSPHLELLEQRGTLRNGERVNSGRRIGECRSL